MKQIMIELSENDYELACKYPDALIAVYAHAIKNGTPLPKGHGRLIDADKCIDELASAVPCFIEDVYSQAYAQGLDRAKIEIDEAETIIPANKEDTE